MAYRYRVAWSAEYAEYVGQYVEFPSLSWLAPTSDDALSGIRRLVAECVADMRDAGEAPPVPIADPLIAAPSE